MFRAVQFVVRNKFVVIGAAVAIFVIFGRNPDEGKPVNPWGSDSVQAAQVSANEPLSEKGSEPWPEQRSSMPGSIFRE